MGAGKLANKMALAGCRLFGFSCASRVGGSKVWIACFAGGYDLRINLR
jgi:hypothetical protein